jgi:antitoxin HicB
MSKANLHVGSSLNDFLEEEGLLAETEATAIKRVIAWQLAEAMKTRGVKKAALARQMGTSRTQVDRLLDANDPGLTLETLSRAAGVLGCRVRFELTVVP